MINLVLKNFYLFSKKKNIFENEKLFFLEIKICEKISYEYLSLIKNDYKENSDLLEKFLDFFKKFQNQNNFQNYSQNEFFENFFFLAKDLLEKKIPELNYQIFNILHLFFLSLLKKLKNNFSKKNFDLEKNFEQIRFIIQIFLEFESEKKLNFIFQKKNFEKNFHHDFEKNKKIHLLLIYNEILMLFQYDVNPQLKAYIIEFFNQISKNFLLLQNI